MKTSKVGILSFICVLLGLLLVLLQCLCWFLFEREALVFTFLILWYPTLFICGLALILGIIAIVTIKLKKGALGGIKLVKGSICLVLLCFLGLYILKLKTTPLIHIQLCQNALRNLDGAMLAYAHDNNDEWPPGPTWCDVLHDKYGRRLDQFICPADNVGPCSYAINEHAVNLGICMPRNMVLFFESKPGWNQVGGPELLNTTNHNGRGCNVSFGGDRAEFVPTSRLGDLRWEANSDNEKQRDDRMVKINNFRVSKKNIEFEYEIRNSFCHNIWVCDAIDIYGEFNVETRIEKEILFIKLRFNLPCNVLLEEAVVAKYFCLQPGATHKGKISLELPIGNASPVYYFDELEVKDTVELHRAVFEVGYFTEDLAKEVSDSIKKGKENPNNETAYFTALTLEGINEGDDSNNVVYIFHLWEEITNEKVLRADITGVSIPCYIMRGKR